MSHDPRSERIYQIVVEADSEDDFFDWQSGGDGDNGEILLCQLDELFREQEMTGSTPRLFALAEQLKEEHEKGRQLGEALGFEEGYQEGFDAGQRAFKEAVLQNFEETLLDVFSAVDNNR